MAEILTGQCFPTMQHDYQTGFCRERANYWLPCEWTILILTREKWWLAMPLRLYSFSFDDLLISAFIKGDDNVMTFIKSHSVLPVALSYIIWVSFLWPWCVSVPPNVRGWGGGEGATEGKPSGEIRALSLCVIQYHACVPMNGCQDIWVQSQGTSHGCVRL